MTTTKPDKPASEYADDARSGWLTLTDGRWDWREDTWAAIKVLGSLSGLAWWALYAITSSGVLG